MLSNEVRQAYLTAMGVDVWTLRQTSSQPIPACVSNLADIQMPVSWATLQQQVATCQQCVLHMSRTQTVFGVGDVNAKLMIIGEAPGMYEDLQGEPFVGRAGQLLNSMLAAIGLSRQTVYIANVLKCRPPKNRDPLPSEVQACTTYLDQQISLLNPKMILAVGRVAAHYLLKTDQAMNQLRNQPHYYHKNHIPLFVTYHPAYLLRSPHEKPKAYRDLLRVKQALKE